jgi:hypothetical protein
MSRYILIRRLRGPAFLLLVGVLALLAQAHILGWGKSWPLFLILAGVLKLAESAALTAEEGYPPPPYPGAPFQAQTYGNPDYPTTGAPPQYPQSAPTAIVPTHVEDYEKDPFGEKS